MDRDAILHAVRQEFLKHPWDTFVSNPPSIAQGGRGVVVPGCAHCKKLIRTQGAYVDHLLDDVLPKILESVGKSR
jgi:hypothetical protein